MSNILRDYLYGKPEPEPEPEPEPVLPKHKKLVRAIEKSEEEE